MVCPQVGRSGFRKKLLQRTIVGTSGILAEESWRVALQGCCISVFMMVRHGAAISEVTRLRPRQDSTLLCCKRDFPRYAHGHELFDYGPMWMFRRERCFETRRRADKSEEVRQARRSTCFRSGTSAGNNLLI